ncbi:ATP-dependent endonuclease [Corallococcus macrosporus]|uniref:ATP-dependent endonuclease n=1 Tax=Corallococcus macrosporus TaxID=35 RepID=A0ABS3D976_9BACT|nr:ATP-dependent endonuclease [Corallococcus macrosporus]MBN8228216.1 ATP-dependent endonuclease [Corallococcus macrosporus]
MKIKSIRIENFRSYRDETISLNDYTCIVGTNGVGKSTILTALNIFFRDQSGASTNITHLDEEDFHNRDTNTPIRITLTFKDLSDAAQEDFRDYYRQGELIISAVAKWDPDLKQAEVLQFGQRRVMKRFKQFFAKYNEGEKVPVLREVYEKLRLEIPQLKPVKVKQEMHDELSNYETSHPELCEPVPSQDQFYGVTKGANRLQRHVHWIYLPAVKDATLEQTESKRSALSALLERALQVGATFDAQLNELRREAESKYRELLSKKQALLQDLSSALDVRIRRLVQSDANLKVEWLNTPENYVSIQDPVARIIAGESRFSGNMARFGHGLQRAFLIALLQELASAKDTSKTTLILGCEEPELYQHPSQAKHLAKVLQTLAGSSYQIITCTHSPHFVSARGFEDVRVVRRDAAQKHAYVSSLTLEHLRTTLSAYTSRSVSHSNSALVRLEQILQPSINEMFFSEVVVFVEGIEDVACITTYLELMGLYDDFIRLGCHFVPCGGKSRLAEPAIVAKGLKIPTFVVFDSDGHEQGLLNRSRHEKDNRELLKICSSQGVEPFPQSTFWAVDHVMWKTEIQGEIESEIGLSEWQLIKDSIRKEYSIYMPSVDKHTLFLAYCLSHAWDKGRRSQSLERLCKSICAFAASATGREGPKLQVTSPPPTSVTS